MDDLVPLRSSDPLLPVIEPGLLAQLFAMGGPALRIALCKQLREDFLRLRDGLIAQAVCPRVAHELKGLAATVGAQRLADMARKLETGESSDVMTVQREIDAVLAELALAAQDSRGA